MDKILIVIATLLFVIQTISLKHIKVSSLRQNLLVNGLLTGIIAIGFAVLTLMTKGTISTTTLYIGLGFGITMVATLVVYFSAMRSGPLSYTAFFFSASMLISAIAGIVIWNEPLTWSTVVGILLFLCAFYFISVLGSEEQSKGSKKWLILCFFTWLFNGSLSLFVKSHQTILKGTESTSMMLIGFATASIVALVVYFFMLRSQHGKEGFKEDMGTVGGSRIPLLGAAIGGGGGNQIVIYLSAETPSSYLFPILQGGIMLLITLYSGIILKEKINRWGRLGILLGLFAIIIINL